MSKKKLLTKELLERLLERANHAFAVFCLYLITALVHGKFQLAVNLYINKHGGREEAMGVWQGKGGEGERSGNRYTYASSVCFEFQQASVGQTLPELSVVAR